MKRLLLSLFIVTLFVGCEPPKDYKIYTNGIGWYWYECPKCKKKGNMLNMKQKAIDESWNHERIYHDYKREA